MAFIERAVLYTSVHPATSRAFLLFAGMIVGAAKDALFSGLLLEVLVLWTYLFQPTGDLFSLDSKRASVNDLNYFIDLICITE